MRVLLKTLLVGVVFLFVFHETEAKAGVGDAANTQPIRVHMLSGSKEYQSEVTLKVLAAYLGLPTVALFGASDARRWRPLGPLVKVLEPAEACPPCFETDSRDCSARTCFDHVSAPGVVAALETMLR